MKRLALPASAVLMMLATAARAACGDEGWAPVGFSLRLDFNNVGLFSCPDPAKLVQAEGAQFTFSYDTLARRESISTDGVAALVFRHFGKPMAGRPNDLPVVAFGPYVQASGSHLFSTATLSGSDSGSITSGAFVQFGLADADRNGQDYVRLRGGVQNASSGATSASFVGEWLPSYDEVFGSWLAVSRPGSIPHIGTPHQSIGYYFAPELQVQYDELVGGTSRAALFRERDSAVRIGPSFALSLYQICTSPSCAGFIDKLTLNLTFHPSIEVQTGRSFSWEQASLGAGVTDNLSVTLTYGYGNAESSANQTSQAKLGFSLKF